MAYSCALVLSACAEPATPTAPAVPSEAVEVVAEPAVPDSLVVDAPPVAVSVPAPPSFDITIAEPGEYEIRATGSPMDPEIFLYQATNLVASDRDGGDGRNARMVRFLDPGEYTVRVIEREARPFTVQLQVRRLAPLEPTATLTLGARLVVPFEEVPYLGRPRNDRDASRALTLPVTEAGTYACTAEASANRDPTMSLIRDDVVIATDDDSGEGNDAQIEQALEPGTYEVRIRDYRRLLNTQITVRCVRR